MNREEAQAHVEQFAQKHGDGFSHSHDNAQWMQHVMDSMHGSAVAIRADRKRLDKIEKRLDVLKGCKRFLASQIGSEIIPRLDALEALPPTRHITQGPCEYCGELPPGCECEPEPQESDDHWEPCEREEAEEYTYGSSSRWFPIDERMNAHEEKYSYRRRKKGEPQYITLAEYVAQAEQRGMAEEEARVIFLETCYAHRNKLETVDTNSDWLNLDSRTFPDSRTVEQITQQNGDWWRLPLIDGELPELPLLNCPDVDGKPVVHGNPPTDPHVYWVTWGEDDLSGKDLSAEECNSRLAAIAKANRWMRERFGQKYREV